MFDAAKLHVTFLEGASSRGPLTPRRYTLTHSDVTGELFLAIGPEYDRRLLRSLQVRLERDEVLGEWIVDEEGPRLELHMMAQGGLIPFGTGAMRRRIFCQYRALVLGAMHYGDSLLAAAYPAAERAPVIARFRWRDGRADDEPWGTWGDWR
jgi:hypothetical protein